MSAVWAIARRELQASWCAPVGYVVTALFLLFTSAVFFGIAPALTMSGFGPGRPATLQLFFEISLWVLVVIAPAITMRAVAEEARSGTLEILLTSPITEGAIVAGKFLGAVAFLALMLAPTLLFVVALEWHGRPDYGEIACGYVGLLLVGATALASGLLASSMTSSQVLAYLLTVFAWLILLLATLGLPLVGGLAESTAQRGEHGPVVMAMLEWVQVVSGFMAAANPLERLRGFVIGLVDTFDLVFFIAFTAVFLGAAARGLSMRRWPAASQGRFTRGFTAGVALLATITIAASVSYFAARPELRLRSDVTKTRAYSLSPQTRSLLADLDGSWTIAVIAVNDDIEPAIRAQAAEVLRRFDRATDAIEVVWIDPSDPGALGDYETIVEQLRGAEPERQAAYGRALDAGEQAFADLQLFAQQHSAALEIALERVTQAEPTALEVRQRIGVLGLLAREGGQVLDAVHAAREVNDVQPVPDYDAVRSTLAAALSQWAQEISVVADVLADWSVREDLDPVAVQFARGAEARWTRLADDLARAADPLLRLEPLEISTAGAALQGGEVAIVLNERGAAVIPSMQLFPRLPVDAGGGAVSFDRRFRGEQVLAAAIRSLREDTAPMVVWVHAEPDSMLRPRENAADVVGLAALLKTARIDVREWPVGREARPVGSPGQPVVWVVVPPTKRTGLEGDQAEQNLVAGVRALIEAGENVLVSAYPSRLPRLRRVDPWARVAESVGVRFDTGLVVNEIIPGTGDVGATIQPNQVIDQFNRDAAIGRAVDGLTTYFPLVVPVRAVDGLVEGRDVLAEVAPGPRRWLEDEWTVAARDVREAPTFEPLAESIPVVVAVERRAEGGGVQRVLAVGSGGWMLTRIADAVAQIGGGRVALMQPGNPEFLQNAVWWLAHRDEVIARSPVQGQLARLEVTPAAARGWALVTIAGLPLASLLLGLIVIWRRRQ